MSTQNEMTDAVKAAKDALSGGGMYASSEQLLSSRVFTILVKYYLDCINSDVKKSGQLNG
jgi:hypothetical protein